MNTLVIFGLGFTILIGALILNFISSLLGLINWFEFVKEPERASVMSYLWLFFLYPLGLGVIAYLAGKIMSV